MRPRPTSGRCQQVFSATPLPEPRPHAPGATVRYPHPPTPAPSQLSPELWIIRTRSARRGRGRGLAKAQLSRRRGRPPGAARAEPRLLSPRHHPTQPSPPAASQGAGAGVSANRGGRGLRPGPERKLLSPARGSRSVAHKAGCCLAAPREHTCSAPRRPPACSSAELGRGCCGPLGRTGLEKCLRWGGEFRFLGSLSTNPERTPSAWDFQVPQPWGARKLGGRSGGLHQLLWTPAAVSLCPAPRLHFHTP